MRIHNVNMQDIFVDMQDISSVVKKNLHVNLTISHVDINILRVNITNSHVDINLSHVNIINSHVDKFLLCLHY